MQQRQLRPGDVLDDYCPRERRITDHAIVAMVDDQIQRTRCVLCDAEHEFKKAKLPAPRKKSSTAALFTQVLDSLDQPPGKPPIPAADVSDPDLNQPEVAAAPATAAADTEKADAPPDAPSDHTEDRPFRRSLIRAQLPRPEGQVPPQRAIPEFTMHQPLGNRGKRPSGGRFRRRTRGDGFDSGAARFHGQGQANGNGNSPGGRRRRRKKH